ncbi:aminopeptidase N [Winogradskyella epiphytica]|uniref:Aminopeptidase N n=1 Tax=Winogradskyella epiphytica TaxID=262005 RepID=A0A2V4XR18_9FLAO|nr:M1 family metallopeptidase [Winogradskyella epiphytica]PYE80286.1 aminopeptidase N [Winogradskyella epiphytica]
MRNLIVIFVLLFVNVCAAQQMEFVDFKRLHASLSFDVDSTMVSGDVELQFKILKDVDSVFLDAVNMKFDYSLNTNDGVQFYNDGKKLWMVSDFKSGVSYIVNFSYQVGPKQALYFVEKNGSPQIWTQGQGKYTSHWLPSLDDTNDKIEFDLTITYDEDYKVLANGQLENIQKVDSLKVWQFDMKQPMSSYLVALAIGDYDKRTETSNSGTPLEFYYYPEDSLKIESTYKYSKEMFDYLEEEIGFPYPWGVYKQVPVHDFLYAGMENTSLTIFSDAFVVDSVGFNDKNYVNVNAHELAHQWFGDLVTAKSSDHHWLQEGFATYYALLAERKVFGDDYFYFKLYQSAQELGRQDVAGEGTSLLNPKSSSLTFYQRGAWVLHALRSKVGDLVFRKAIQNYLENHQFSIVQTSDFISEVEVLAEQDLSGFVDIWIVQKEFPFDDAIGLLKEQSMYIQEYIMVDCEAKTSKCAEYLKYDVSDDAKAKIIAQVPYLVNANTFKNGLKVRQAISQYVSDIPKELKSDYESLLNDKSYITIENALYNLWVNFPQERSKYLIKTQDVIGFSDKNVRLLWLVLHLNTLEFQVDKKQAMYDELLSYTAEKWNADLRIKAFQYLNLIKACAAECETNLETAKSHHNWRMVKFARQFSERLDQNKEE